MKRSTKLKISLSRTYTQLSLQRLKEGKLEENYVKKEELYFLRGTITTVLVDFAGRRKEKFTLFEITPQDVYCNSRSYNPKTGLKLEGRQNWVHSRNGIIGSYCDALPCGKRNVGRTPIEKGRRYIRKSSKDWYS